MAGLDLKIAHDELDDLTSGTITVAILILIFTMAVKKLRWGYVTLKQDKSDTPVSGVLFLGGLCFWLGEHEA